ncbi:MAG TPA: sulfite exporter TauE/SafE family protein [Anaeromyxobacteraceae bacterium]|nr:sulfite exporter TauE/SafE family protein [Anaeromyxobacteraceae bacterium]
MIWLLLAAAGFGAGVINAIAGGGSLLSFPALLLTGMGSVAANATNTLAVWPGTVSSTWAYRSHILDERRRGIILTVPSAVGGLLGSWVLLNTPEKAFNAVVPWLIILACALISFQNPIARFVRSHRAQGEGRVPPALWMAQLLVSFYGGYFGAGMGIIMLAFMGILLPTSLQHANGLKLLFSLVINGVAAVYFLVAGAASLPHAALMAAASIVGGIVGAHLAQRLPAGIMRAVVVAYGLVVAVVLLRK